MVRIIFKFVSWIIFVSKDILFNFNLVMSSCFPKTGVVISPDRTQVSTSWPYFGVKLSCVCLKQPLTINIPKGIVAL